MSAMLLKVSLIMHLVSVIWLICAVLLILIILVQKGRGGGLSGALTGGAAGNLLGSKTGDFLTWVTVSLVGMFLLLTILMAMFYRPIASSAAPGQEPPARKQPAPPKEPEAKTTPAIPDVNEQM